MAVHCSGLSRHPLSAAKQGGIPRLYRGVLPACLRPQALCMYTGNEWAKARGRGRVRPCCRPIGWRRRTFQAIAHKGDIESALTLSPPPPSLYLHVLLASPAPRCGVRGAQLPHRPSGGFPDGLYRKPCSNTVRGTPPYSPAQSLQLHPTCSVLSAVSDLHATVTDASTITSPNAVGR